MTGSVAIKIIDPPVVRLQFPNEVEANHGTLFSVVAAGIARTIYLGRAQAEVYDKSWSAFDIFVASIAECNVAIACACAPSLTRVFGRFFRDMSIKHGSGGNSKTSSKTDSSHNNDSRNDIYTDFSESSDAIDKMKGPMKTLRAKTSRLKAKIGGNKKETIDICMREDGDSFKETHEHQIASLDPVASGLGDGLVSPMERKFSRIMHQRNSQIAEAERTSMNVQNVRQLPGPGKNIGSYISPPPSISSSSEASLVDKRVYSRDGDLPYGLPEGEELKLASRMPWLETQPPVPDIPPRFRRPLPDLDPSPGILLAYPRRSLKIRSTKIRS